MKKLSVLFITLILTFALSACGRNAMDNNSINGGTNSHNSNSNNNSNNNSQNSTLTPSTPTNENLSNEITREKALEIAFEKAGVKQADVRDLEIELDTENGVKVWEIDFEHKNLEYSYDVNAQSGAITKTERERND